MGFNTSMVILNDALNYIQTDPEFGSKVYDACMRVNSGKPIDISSGGYINAATVIETHHADRMVVLIVGGNDAINTGVDVNFNQSKTDIELEALKRLADKWGFSLRKKSMHLNKDE